MDAPSTAQVLRKIIDDLHAAIDKNVVAFDETNALLEGKKSEDELGELTAERQILQALEELFDENRDPDNPFDPAVDADEKIAPSRDQILSCIDDLERQKAERQKEHPLIPFLFEHRHKEFLASELAVYDDIIAKLTA